MNKEKIQRYKDSKDSLETSKLIFQRKKDEFEKQNANIISEINEKTIRLEELKQQIKEDAEREYNETKEKYLLGCISIRVSKDVIYDEKTALGWAKEHKICLSLNKTAFKKIAKIQEPDFVEIKDKVTVCFPKEIIIENGN